MWQGLVACFQRQDLQTALAELHDDLADDRKANIKAMSRAFPVTFCTHLAGLRMRVAIVFGPMRGTEIDGPAGLVKLYDQELSDTTELMRAFLMRHEIVKWSQGRNSTFILQFPCSRLRGPRADLWKGKFCKCQKEGGRYVECTRCARWYHTSCAGLAEVPLKSGFVRCVTRQRRREDAIELPRGKVAKMRTRTVAGAMAAMATVVTTTGATTNPTARSREARMVPIMTNKAARIRRYKTRQGRIASEAEKPSTRIKRPACSKCLSFLPKARYMACMLLR